eukprot:6192329-Pleurochrysis_carterae.AAC.1
MHNKRTKGPARDQQSRFKSPTTTARPNRLKAGGRRLNVGANGLSALASADDHSGKLRGASRYSCAAYSLHAASTVKEHAKLQARLQQIHR